MPAGSRRYQYALRDGHEDGKAGARLPHSKLKTQSSRVARGTQMVQVDIWRTTRNSALPLSMRA